jgi:phenylacetate-coenzyme A ligase PaaK-like adenylate-forming protein
MSILNTIDALRAHWSFPGDGMEEYLILLEERARGLERLSRFRPDTPAQAGLRGESQSAELVSKADLQRDFERYASASLGDMPLWWKTTSGTSGRPVDIPYDAAFYLDFKYGVFHKVWRMLHGEPLGDRPYFALVVSDVTGDESRICIDPLFSQGVVARLSIDVGEQNQLRVALALMSALGPDILSTKPTVLAAMVGAASELAPRAEVIIVGGAALAPTLRQEAEARFHGKAVSLYATSEVGVVASECAHGRLHVFESDVDVTDDHPESPSEIIVTSLGNRALPLTGYRTGDKGSIAREPCSCGAAWRWIERLDGRIVPLFRFSGGEVFSPTRFNSFLRCFPQAREFQVTLAARDELEVLIEHFGAPTAEDRARMERFFADAVPDYVRFRFSDHVFDPNEKFARFRVVA